MITSAPALLVIVADADAASAAACREALADAGHQVLHAWDGRQLAALCRDAPPGLIVTDLGLPDGPALPAIAEATRDRRVPVIVVADDWPAEALDAGGDLAVEAVLTKPVAPAALRAAAALAVRRFARDEALRAEVAGLRQQLEDRKLIERAKGVVTRRLGLDEAEAYRRLRRLSADRNQKVSEAARRVLDCDAVFDELERAAGPRPPGGPQRHESDGNGAARGLGPSVRPEANGE